MYFMALIFHSTSLDIVIWQGMRSVVSSLLHWLSMLWLMRTLRSRWQNMSQNTMLSSHMSARRRARVALARIETDECSLQTSASTFPLLNRVVLVKHPYELTLKLSSSVNN
jgi:hypothetical protein